MNSDRRLTIDMSKNIDLSYLDQCLATHSYSDIDQSVWDKIDRHFARYGSVLDSRKALSEFDAVVNQFKRSQVEAYRKQEIEQLEAKAKEKFFGYSE
jgi:hypothetical protein